MTHKLQDARGRCYVSDQQAEKINRDAAQAMRDAARAEYIAKRQGGHQPQAVTADHSIGAGVQAAADSVDRLQSAQTGSDEYRAFLARRHGRFSS